MPIADICRVAMRFADQKPPTRVFSKAFRVSPALSAAVEKLTTQDPAAAFACHPNRRQRHLDDVLRDTDLQLIAADDTR